jgi:hypothetical protein
MASLSAIKERFVKLQGQEITLAAAAINENGEFAADLNADQLAKGLKVDGTAANFTYSPFTIAVKRTKSGLASITSHLTNYDTGESYNKLYEKVVGKKVIFGTGTDKEADISDRMDNEAFGLTPDNKEIFMKEKVRPDFVKRVRNFVNL